MKTRILPFFFLAITFVLASCTSAPENKPAASESMEQITESLPITTQELTYTTEDGLSMKGYLAMPEGATGDLPAALIIHEWWGHNNYARLRADMMAELGYVAMAIDMYGDGKQAGHPEDAQKFAMTVMGNLESAQARFDAAYEQLQSLEGINISKTVALGYCFGGSVAMTMANLGKPLDAVVAFHSGLQLPAQPQEGIETRYLVLNGAADPFVTEEQKINFKKAMDEAGLSYEFVDYEGAVHAYTNPGADSLGEEFNLPLKYDAAADSASWAKMKDFLGI
jgi:dienelactone hydrolase